MHPSEGSVVRITCARCRTESRQAPRLRDTSLCSPKLQLRALSNINYIPVLYATGFTF